MPSDGDRFRPRRLTWPYPQARACVIPPEQVSRMSSVAFRVSLPAPSASCRAQQRRGDASTSRARSPARVAASTGSRRVDMNPSVGGYRCGGSDRRVRIARWVPHRKRDAAADDASADVRAADSPNGKVSTSDPDAAAARATAQWEEAQEKVDRFFLEPEADPEATRAEAKRLVEELLLAKEAEIRLKKEKEDIAARAAANEALLAEETRALLEQQRAAVQEIIEEAEADNEEAELDELLATVEEEVRELEEELAETLGAVEVDDVLHEVEEVATEAAASATEPEAAIALEEEAAPSAATDEFAPGKTEPPATSVDPTPTKKPRKWVVADVNLAAAAKAAGMDEKKFAKKFAKKMKRKRQLRAGDKLASISTKYRAYNLAEYLFVRLSLFLSSGFVLLGVCATLMLGSLLFTMGVKEVIFEGVMAWVQFNPVELVTAAVGALDRFLLGMVCLVFGLGSFELFLSRTKFNQGDLQKPAWLRVSSIDDLEHKVGQIIVAIMVVNLLEMSLHMSYHKPLELVYAAACALLSAGALAVLHWSHANKHGDDHGNGSASSAH